MIFAPKNDGTLCRTVDLQRLNAQCLREIHHCPCPFQLVSHIPANTSKTVLDTVDGYHAISLDQDSQYLTASITEWGRFMYKHIPQGFMAAGDIYTKRYDEIIKDILQKVKCVDDTLLYNNSIEQAFCHFSDYLYLCASNGIVINNQKF